MTCNYLKAMTKAMAVDVWSDDPQTVYGKAMGVYSLAACTAPTLLKCPKRNNSCNVDPNCWRQKDRGDAE
jgi:hypothetical protein